MDENISRAAGAAHGQELDEDEFRAIVEPLGRTLEQRTTLYGRTTTVGRRLRPATADDHGHEHARRRRARGAVTAGARRDERCPTSRTSTSSGSATRSSTS